MTGVIPVVILNWNGEDDTLACLKSIRSAERAGFVPVVVDNGSDPDSVARLRRESAAIFPRVLGLAPRDLDASGADPGRFAPYLGDDALVLIESPENLGFASGSNLGVRFAGHIGASWVMLLNNDTVVLPNTFTELRRFVESHPAFPAVTAQIRLFEPPTRIQNCGGDLTYFGSRRYRFANADAASLPKAPYSVVSFVTGCALLFNHRELGPLTEDFFFGEEDYEFALRLRKRGLRMACVHDAVVHHKVGASIGRSARPLGTIIGNYVTRLINVRNYYSRARWHATRLLAYLYLPVLLARNGIHPLKTVPAIRRVESFLRRNRTIGRAEFQSLVASDS